MQIQWFKRYNSPLHAVGLAAHTSTYKWPKIMAWCWPQMTTHLSYGHQHLHKVNNIRILLYGFPIWWADIHTKCNTFFDLHVSNYFLLRPCQLFLIDNWLILLPYTEVLLYHVVPGTYFSAGLTDGLMLKTAATGDKQLKVNIFTGSNSSRLSFTQIKCPWVLDTFHINVPTSIDCQCAE